MKWSCEDCNGDCCELFAPIAFGCDCPHLNKETKLCDVYENRPVICRTSLIRLLHKEGISIKKMDIEDYLIARCRLIKHLKAWKMETPTCQLLHKEVIEAISKTKLENL